MKELPCLFTKQKTKKKKIFQDGVIKIQEGGSVGTCLILLDNSSKQLSSIILEVKHISTIDLAKLTSGQEFEIDFENYCVQVEGVKETKHPSILILDKPKALVKPFSVPVSKAPIVALAQKGNELLSEAPLQTGSRYAVDDDELDSLWAEAAHSQTDEKDCAISTNRVSKRILSDDHEAMPTKKFSFSPSLRDGEEIGDNDIWGIYSESQRVNQSSVSPTGKPLPNSSIIDVGVDPKPPVVVGDSHASSRGPVVSVPLLHNDDDFSRNASQQRDLERFGVTVGGYCSRFGTANYPVAVPTLAVAASREQRSASEDDDDNIWGF